MEAAFPVPCAGERAGRVLARLLAEAGFTHTQLGARLGTPEDLPPARELPLCVRRLGEPDELGVLVRLFLLELPVAAAEARRLVRAPLVEVLLGVGLLVPDGESYRAASRITPHGGLLVASDVHLDPPPPGFVPGVQGPSHSLAALTVRRSVERALDVGTGCGWQALLLARHARAVVATDVSERAIGYAALNARLNGIENIELRVGSFFEPVGDELFDLIVSNPPYPLSPGGEFVFRDSGLARDGVSALVVRELPRRLRPGGIGTVLIAWVEDEGKPQRWLEGSGCDAWLFRTWSHDALESAIAWNSAEPDPTEYLRRVEEWLAYYERERIGRIGYGCLVVRHRGGGEGRMHEISLAARPTDAGAQVERLIAAAELLRSLADEELLRMVLVPAPDAVLVRESRVGETRWSLRLGEGLGLAAALDERTAHLLEALDGSRTLAAALELAASGQEAAGLRIARGLIAGGFVTAA